MVSAGQGERHSSTDVAKDPRGQYQSTVGRPLLISGEWVDPCVAATDRVLLIGGTGAIGSVMTWRLAQLGLESVTCVGNSRPAFRIDGVEYENLDVCNARDVRDLIARVQPTHVFHLAAVRDPEQAEWNPRAAIDVNVRGLKNVLDGVAACRSVRHLSYASTGKCMRWYSQDVYSCSKRVAEAVLAEWSLRHPRVQVSGSRFTHVVDNGLIWDSFTRSAHVREALDVYNLDTHFYLQSAREGAELMFLGTHLPRTGQAALLAKKGFGIPITAGQIATEFCQSNPGRDIKVVATAARPGHSVKFYQGLIDPIASLQGSPLFNGFEHGDSIEGPYSAEVEYVKLDERWGAARKLVADLPTLTHHGLHDAVCQIMQIALAGVPKEAIQEAVIRAEATGGPAEDMVVVHDALVSAATLEDHVIDLRVAELDPIESSFVPASSMPTTP